MVKIYTNEQWIQVAGYYSYIIEVPTYSNLPSTGQSETLYITKNTNYMYRWDTTTTSYQQVGGSSGGGSWGEIDGDIEDQEDLIELIDSKISLAVTTVLNTEV